MGNDNLIGTAIPAEVGVALTTSRPQLLAPLEARLAEGEVLPPQQVLGLVRLVGSQIQQIFDLEKKLNELDEAVLSLGQAERAVDTASDALREQLKETTRLLHPQKRKAVQVPG
jgi:hypothetical protein